MERPKLSQDDIRDVFGVGQTVLVRDGNDWRSREILGISVLRSNWRRNRNASCPHCGMSLRGEPRFWFKSLGNVSLDEIIAKEDIDPVEVKKPGILVGTPLPRTPPGHEHELKLEIL